MKLQDHPEAEPLVKAGAAIAFNNISFQYPGGMKVFDKFNLRLQPGSGSGWSVSPAAENPVCSCCCNGSTMPAGQHYHRWPGHLAGHAAKPASGDFGGAAGHFDVSSLDHGKHPVRAADRDRRRGIACRNLGALRFHRNLAGRHGHHGRRPRRQTLGRPAAAYCDRARLPEGCADPTARRSHRRTGQRVRGGDPGKR